MNEENLAGEYTQENGPDRAKGTDSGQTALILLIVVAVLASVVMLFTDSNNALKIALLAALWAAIIGFFLVYRYRAQARDADARIELTRQLHAAELEQVRAQGTSAVAPVAAGDEGLNTQILVELREEIAGLRAQLEELSGYRFDYEPEAIRAEAKRIMEVEARAANQRVAEEMATEREERASREAAAAPVTPEPVPVVEPERPTPEPAPEPTEARPETRDDETSGRGLPTREPSANPFMPSRADTAEHKIVPDTGEAPAGGSHRRPTGAPTREAVAGRVGRQDYQQSSTNPLSALITENSRREAESAQPEKLAEPTRRGGRRRRDENNTGVSVADLMKNLKKDTSEGPSEDQV